MYDQKSAPLPQALPERPFPENWSTTSSAKSQPPSEPVRMRFLRENGFDRSPYAAKKGNDVVMRMLLQMERLRSRRTRARMRLHCLSTETFCAPSSAVIRLSSCLCPSTTRLPNSDSVLSCSAV